MTVEDMAREAGMHQDGDNWYCVGPGKYDDHDVTTEALARFAALVRRQALEDAAKACRIVMERPLQVGSEIYDMGRSKGAEDCAAAIRALADKP